MKIKVVIGILSVVFRTISAQCVVEDNAMDTCMDSAGLSDVDNNLCDVCIGVAAQAAVVAGTTCADLSGGQSSLCTALEACPTCPDSCAALAQVYALCEVNEELGGGCTELVCGSVTPSITPAPVAAMPVTAPAPAAVSPTTTEECAAEDNAMDTCMDSAGLSDVDNNLCDVCIGVAAQAAVVAGTTCADLSGGQSSLCTALEACPTCPDSCAALAQVYALCEVNEELGGGCTELVCGSVTPSMTPIPVAATPAPVDVTPPTAPVAATPTTAPVAATPAPVVVTPPTAPVAVMPTTAPAAVMPTTAPVAVTPTTAEGCLTEDTAMDACMDSANLSDVDNNLCDVCIGVAAQAAVVAGTTCADLSGGQSSLCTALEACPTCPDSCAALAQVYALCEVNEELGGGCPELVCGSVTPSMTRAPVMATPSPMTTPAPVTTSTAASIPPSKTIWCFATAILVTISTVW